MGGWKMAFTCHAERIRFHPDTAAAGEGPLSFRAIWTAQRILGVPEAQ
jgi:hypothetical protein